MARKSVWSKFRTLISTKWEAKTSERDDADWKKLIDIMDKENLAKS